MVSRRLLEEVVGLETVTHFAMCSLNLCKSAVIV